MAEEKVSADNVIIFIADAVRYGCSHEQLASIGRTHQTISASQHTPASVPSMLTGLHPPEHGVQGFTERVPDEIRSLFDVPELSAKFSAKPELQKIIGRNFPDAEPSKLDDMESPFVWVERGPGGHAPYNQFDEEKFHWGDEGANKYLHRLASQPEQFRADYRAAVDRSTERFRELIEKAEQFDGETLLIYTSDHGELLGDRGLLGHGYTACPEMVTVPTTFVHPSLSAGKSDELARGIDLFPTVLSVMGREEIVGEWQLPGVSAFGDETPSAGYTHFEGHINTPGRLPNIDRIERSVWDQNGGHVYIDSSQWEALALYLGIFLKQPLGKLMRTERTFQETFEMFAPGYKRFGKPDVSVREAKDLMRDVKETTSTELTLSGDAKDQLKNLGYLTD